MSEDVEEKNESTNAKVESKAMIRLYIRSCINCSMVYTFVWISGNNYSELFSVQWD